MFSGCAAQSSTDRYYYKKYKSFYFEIISVCGGRGYFYSGGFDLEGLYQVDFTHKKDTLVMGFKNFAFKKDTFIVNNNKLIKLGEGLVQYKKINYRYARNVTDKNLPPCERI